jgi:hypothetical protein
MKNPQVSATIPAELREQLKGLAIRENRSISEMASLLLAQAIKERNRKKKLPLQDDTKDIPV